MARTITFSPPEVASPENGHAYGAPQPPRSRRRFFPLILGVALVLFCGLTFASMQSAAGARVPVLAVTQPIAAGSSVTDDKLRVVEVNVPSGTKLLPESKRGEVIGRVAKVDLLPGMLVARELIDVEQATRGVVAIPLRAGRAPALSPGDVVTIVDTTQTIGVALPGLGQGNPDPGARRMGVGTVRSAEGPTQNGETIVSLEVDDSVASQVAVKANAGEVSLVLQSGRTP